jgi:hypothetical protein
VTSVIRLPAVFIVALLASSVLFQVGCKDESTAEESAPAPEDEAPVEGEESKDAAGKPGEAAFDMSALQFALAPPWTSNYKDFLQSWVWSKAVDPTLPPLGRFYVGKMPPGVPLTVDHYASKLMHEPGFQDSAYLYTEVERKEILDDGWIIVGKEKSTLEPKAEPTMGFVVYRDLGGRKIRCRGGQFPDPKDLELVLAACKAATF